MQVLLKETWCDPRPIELGNAFCIVQNQHYLFFQLTSVENKLVWETNLFSHIFSPSHM